MIRYGRAASLLLVVVVVVVVMYYVVWFVGGRDAPAVVDLSDCVVPVCLVCLST